MAAVVGAVLMRLERDEQGMDQGAADADVAQFFEM
jgi:hypothetical protein